MYYVIWKNDYIQSLKKRFNQNELLEQLSKHFLRLKKQFPTLSYTCDLRSNPYSKYQQQNNYIQTGNWILNLNECTADEREAIKERIATNTSITCLSYVISSNPTLFSDGSCNVTLSPFQPTLSKEFLNALAHAGFKLNPAVSPGSNGTYFFSYAHPMIDLHYFETYNRLCEEFPTYLFYILTRGYEHIVDPSEMSNFNIKE